jgi:hypothetical protein
VFPEPRRVRAFYVFLEGLPSAYCGRIRVPDAYRPRLANSYYDSGADQQQQILRKVCLKTREAINN